MAQIKITLTPEAENFVRENFSKMSRKEMVKRLNITRGKLDSNIVFMKLGRKRSKTYFNHDDSNEVFFKHTKSATC